MVYKKYIKRGGKLFGPYYYRSIKKGGKVITQYVKNPNDFPKKKFSIGYKKINKNFLILPILFLILIAGFFILKPVLTGKVILSVDNSYVSQEALFGELKLNLEPNEFIPADTKVLINNEEFILRNLIKEAPKPGEFYISGTEISGTIPADADPANRICSTANIPCTIVYEKKLRLSEIAGIINNLDEWKVPIIVNKQSDLIYETVIVTSVNTGTGVVTVSANIEYYEEYTTSNQAGISFNMAADGFCEFDGLRNIYEPLWNWGSTEPIFSELIYPFSAYD